ncbi:MAG: hypothetical protein P8Y20_12380 [Gammaproteobacteria bacterium]
MRRLLVILLYMGLSIPAFANDENLIDGNDLLERVKKQINNIDTMQLRQQLQQNPMT